MSLTILSIAYPFAPVGSHAVGGSEQVLSGLEAALVERGYRSVVVARNDSKVSGHLLGTPVPPGLLTTSVRLATERAHQANIDEAFASYPLDLVHMHGMEFHKYRIPPQVPVLVTLHMPPSWYDDEIWRLPAQYQLQCVSEAQRAECPAWVRDQLPIVENGVRILEPDDRGHGRFALILSRICQEKNLHLACDAARMARLPVLLAGEVFPYEEHIRYFDQEIRPRLGRGVRFIGPVCGEQKHRLLARAACLLLPTLAPETSSLVAMEALSAGTPVCALPSGAIPSIVEHGRTGFLAKDVGGMAEAIAKVHQIDRAECRAVAAARFALPRMVENYEAIYQRLTGKVDGTGGRRMVCSSRALDAPAIEVLRSTTEMEALVPEWIALWRSDPRSSPFQSPEWLLPWWRHVGEGRLHALTLRDRYGRLRGLLPLYIYRQPVTGERQLLLLGAGTSDYLDGIFAPPDNPSDLAEEALAGTALRFLAQNPERWDTAFFHQLRPHSPLLAYARNAGIEITHSDACSYIDAHGRQIPMKMRSNISYCRRRANNRGALRCVTAADSVTALQLFDTLVMLQHRRWHGRGEPSVLQPEKVQRQHRDAIPSLLRAGTLRLFSLTLEGGTLGVFYGLMDPVNQQDRSLYFYLIGFDPGQADLSPGTLLIHYARQQCEEEGMARLDFLRGSEAYKKLWGAVSEPTHGFLLTPEGEPIRGSAGFHVNSALCELRHGNRSTGREPKSQLKDG